MDGPSGVRRWPSFLGRVLTLLSLAFFFIKLLQNVQSLSALQITVSSVALVTGGVLLFMLLYILLVRAWMVILKGGGVDISLVRAYRIMGESQIGKYLPGNIYHYVRRVSLGSKEGLPTESCILSLGVETVLLAFTALAISLIGFLSGRLDLAWFLGRVGVERYRSIGLIVLVIVAGIVIGGAFSHRIRRWLKARLEYLHPVRVVTAVLLYALFFACVGGFIAFLLGSLWNINASPGWYALSWGFTLAWLLGFITPGAPGGIGIREIVFVGLFSSEIGEGTAVSLAVIVRVITSLSDIGTFGVAAWIGRRVEGA
jgi:hypothetical protein